jgi:hypothetical protein
LDKPHLVMLGPETPADFVRMSDDTLLPVTYGSLLEAQLHKWYTPVDRVFNSIFYAALRSVGVLMEDANPAIALLSRHKQALHLTAAQVRGVYGLEKGVFTSQGRFLLESDWERDLLAARAKGGSAGRHPGPFANNLDVWDQIERDGSTACRGKSDQANIDVEFRWIRANLAEWPDFSQAPSRGAIKDWLEINRPGAEALKRDFLTLAWKRRLPPGDRTPKASSGVFEEDKVEDESLREYDQGLEDRLSGGEQEDVTDGD